MWITLGVVRSGLIDTEHSRSPSLAHRSQSLCGGKLAIRPVSTTGTHRFPERVNGASGMAFWQPRVKSYSIRNAKCQCPSEGDPCRNTSLLYPLHLQRPGFSSYPSKESNEWQQRLAGSCLSPPSYHEPFLPCYKVAVKSGSCSSVVSKFFSLKNAVKRKGCAGRRKQTPCSK